MIKVEIKDFQSVGHVKIKVEGFTALVGRSNIGKSAVVRAIRCALTNPVGTSFVRHGDNCARQFKKNAKTCKCFASVHLQMEDFDLLWEKGDSVNRYTFNGQEYDKPDKGVPDFLTKSGFSPVKTGDETGCIQVADQFFPIFLLNQSGTAIAESISDVSRLDRINSATKLVEKERREVMATRKVREKDISDLEQDLKSYEPLEGALSLVAEAEATFHRLAQVSASATSMGRYSAALDVLTADIYRLGTACESSLPELLEVNSTSTTLRELHTFLGKISARDVEIKALHSLESALTIPDIEVLTTKSSFYYNLTDWLSNLRNIKTTFTAFESASKISLPDLGPVAFKVSNLGSMSVLSSRHTSLHPVVTYLETKTLPSLVDVSELPPQVGNLAFMSNFIQHITPLLSQVEDLSSKQSKFEVESQKIQAEIDKIGVCPTCAQPVSGGHSHAKNLVSLSD